MKIKNLLFVVLSTFGFNAMIMAQILPNYVPADGLVGWWPFNGNANDESVNGNNGTVNGASLSEDRFGIPMNAYEFSQDYIEIQPIVSLNSANDFTWSTWVQLGIDAANGQNYIMSRGWDYAGGFNLWMNHTKSYLIANGFYSFQQGTSSFNFVNNWKHILVSRQTGVINFYIDGILDTTYVYNAPIQTNNEKFYFGVHKWIGQEPGYFPYYFRGKIDDIGIWNRALTQEEVTALFNAVNCSSNTSISPQTNSLHTGSSALFTATTTDSNPSYVWQSNLGQGFQNLNNIGNYSGTNTASLSIVNVQLSEHNQPIRVISTSGECVDTSDIVSISITDTCINFINDTTFTTVTDTLIISTLITGINSTSNTNTIKVFPNPANNHITIDYGNFAIMNGYQLIIENSLGQQVFQTFISLQSDYLSLNTWGGNGLYFVHIIDTQGNTIDIRKIVLQ
jgi:hypothetical protein